MRLNLILIVIVIILIFALYALSNGWFDKTKSPLKLPDLTKQEQSQNLSVPDVLGESKSLVENTVNDTKSNISNKVQQTGDSIVQTIQSNTNSISTSIQPNPEVSVQVLSSPPPANSTNNFFTIDYQSSSPQKIKFSRNSIYYLNFTNLPNNSCLLIDSDNYPLQSNQTISLIFSTIGTHLINLAPCPETPKSLGEITVE